MESVQEAALAPGFTRARRSIPEAPWMRPSEDGVQTSDLFAFLAERGAALVDRQHAVLEALQDGEQDPQRLAGLFRLDHLAAQLRRNSNAALVLAGLPSIRSIHDPALLSELAYAAVSEVNGYQRVTVGAFPTRRVHTRVASDLVHLLGDLLENALAVSPRAAGVWVRGQRPHSLGTNAPAVVKVADSGTALSDAALEHLNNMLAGRAEPTRTGREVGLVVTREIARRHGLTVQFKPLVNGGLVATVELPDAVFEPPGTARDTPTPTGHRTPPTHVRIGA